MAEPGFAVSALAARPVVAVLGQQENLVRLWHVVQSGYVVHYTDDRSSHSVGMRATSRSAASTPVGGSPARGAALRWPPFHTRIAVVDESTASLSRLRAIVPPCIELVWVPTPDRLHDALLTRLDVLVTDHALSWGSCTDVIRQALAAMPEVPIVVMTSRGNPAVAVEALRAGAADYLGSEADDHDIGAALLNQLSPWNGPVARDPMSVPGIFAALGVGVTRSTPDGAVVDASDRIARLAGEPDLEGVRRRGAVGFYRDSAVRQKWLTRVEAEGRIRKLVGVSERADGQPVWSDVDLRAVRGGGGATQFYDALAFDCSDREKLRGQVVLQAAALDQLSLGVMGLDADRRIRYWNRQAEVIHGWSAEEAMGKSLLELIVPPENRSLHDHLVGIFNEADHYDFECDDLTKGGCRVWLHKSVTVVRNATGQRIGLVAVIADFREFRAKQEQLQRALADREALLREVNHRVKNNLQVVSSLLGIQARHVATPELRRAVQACRERIQTIAVAHELLYRNVDHDRIDLRAYLEQLLARLSLPRGGAVQVSLGHVEPAALGVELTIALGLMVNELVSAAFARADVGALRVVTVGFYVLPDGSAELLVRETGDVPPEPPALVAALADQVRARCLSERHGDATVFRITVRRP